MERLDRLEAVQSMLLEIGERSTSCNDLFDFIGAVHRALGRIMYAANFYVALCDREEGMISFPYFIDEVDAEMPVTGHKVPLAAPEESPTSWVVVNKRRLLITADDFEAREREGMQWGHGATAEHWMGAPLLDRQQHRSEERRVGKACS